MRPVSEKFWTVLPDGIVVSVRVTPKGGRDAIDGVERLADGQAVLRVRVRAAPSGGEANAALMRLLAELLHVPRRDMALASGATARVKRIRIAGNAEALTAALETLVGLRP